MNIERKPPNQESDAYSKAVRRSGKITKWKDDQGFGFITPLGGGQPIFVHIKAFSARLRRPSGNEFVTYETGSDQQGRVRAERVEYLSNNPLTTIRGLTTSIAIGSLFFLFLSVSVFIGSLPFVVLLFYVVASVVSFFAYRRDKKAAQDNRLRTPETTLHLLDLIGGWPGAFVAQRVYRHKVKKLSFQVMYWLTVVLNCCALAWLLAAGDDGLKLLLTRALELLSYGEKK